MRDLNWIPNFKAGIQVLKKLVIPSSAGDPAGVADGWLWIDSTAGKLAVRVAGATVLVPLASELGTGGLTQEQIEDFIALMVQDNADIDWTYTDNGAGAGALVGVYKANSVEYDKIQQASATNRVLGRISAGAGNYEELTGANIRTILGALDADTLGGETKAQIIADAVATVLNGAPGALDTLNELAAALGNDANFAATTATSIAARARYKAGAVPNGATPQTINHALALANMDDYVLQIKDTATHKIVEYDLVTVDANNIQVIDEGGAAIPAGLRYFLVVGA